MSYFYVIIYFLSMYHHSKCVGLNFNGVKLNGPTFHDGKIYSTVIFSSPELKAQVSFSHQNLYVVVNFSYCHLLLQTSEPISTKLG